MVELSVGNIKFFVVESATGNRRGNFKCRLFTQCKNNSLRKQPSLLALDGCFRKLQIQQLRNLPVELYKEIFKYCLLMVLIPATHSSTLRIMPFRTPIFIFSMYRKMPAL